MGNVSGSVAECFKYWCGGAALLPVALGCGRECAAIGMCAACGGHVVGYE